MNGMELIFSFIFIENNNSNFTFYSLTNEMENLCMNMEEKLNTSNESFNQSDLATPVKDLNFESIPNRDLEMEEYAKCFRSIYENQFNEYLKTLKKNDPISVTSLPTKEYCKETYEIDSMNATTAPSYSRIGPISDDTSVHTFSSSTRSWWSSWS